ncbi:dnaJ homolog subfamily C member 16-like isoform X2 [Antedon mediterranea]|uniref:dnaJ homolog subfamily C member 16-like isoform X2 n=1 Tax=Antedon mediterranea TaxID=105859 RepID=UPI003AF5898A
MIDAAEPDHYDVLGVRRTASLKEIKLAYKKLALELHPDKNDDPDSGRRFVALNNAYEILSNEGKRRQYDDRQKVQNHNTFQANDNFTFKERTSLFVTFDIYYDLILPVSRKKAFLLLVTERDFLHHEEERIWESNVKKLEKAGIGIATVHVDLDRQLVLILGVNKIPSIVGVLDETIYYLGSQTVINIDSLKAFAISIFPTTNIEKVDDDNYKNFLAGYSDNRPRTLLFSRKASPSLLYLTTAYKFRDKMAFGFASFKSQVNTMRRHYDVNSTCLMVFKEDTEQYTAHLELSHLRDSLSSTMLQRMHEIIIKNMYLYAPRLTSQQVFDDLCPVSSTKKTGRICVILFTQKGKHDEFLRTFGKVAMNTALFPQGTKFMYVYEETQTAFKDKFGVNFEQEILPVALVWRKKINKLKFDWLPGGWKLDDKEDNEKRLQNYLLDLSKFNIELSKTRTFEMLRDENELHWLMLWIKSIRSSFISYLNSYSNSVYGKWLILVLMVLILICSLVAFMVG